MRPDEPTGIVGDESQGSCGRVFRHARVHLHRLGLRGKERRREGAGGSSECRVGGVCDAGYKVLRKEKEEDDAEIEYQGGGKTGQIALRNSCGESDKIAVNITNRPQ